MNAFAHAHEAERCAAQDEQLQCCRVSVKASRVRLYEFWRDFRNLPRFMHSLRSVRVTDALRSNWVVAGPGNQSVAWESVITQDVPAQSIAWSTTEDSWIPHSGRVEFRDAPDGQGTEVMLYLSYDSPDGAVEKLLAHLFRRDPTLQARRDLQRFKQLMETDADATEIPRLPGPRLLAADGLAFSAAGAEMALSL